MNSKEHCNGVRTRFFILLLAAGVFVNGRCKALNPQEQYDRVLSGCREKLAAWGTLSTQNSPSPAPSGSNSNNSESAEFPLDVFMRGGWKQGSGHAAFLSRKEGNFDFFSSRWAGSPAENERVVQNMSASMFFGYYSDRNTGPESILQATGVYNSRSEEICLLGCIQKLGSGVTYDTGTAANNTNDGTETVAVYNPQYEDTDQDCSIRGLLKLSGRSKTGRTSVEGILESLRNGSDSQYFTTISLTGSMVDSLYQQALYHLDISVRSLLYALEAVILIWQIVHSMKSPSGYFVSMLMILVQIVTMCFLAVRLIYIPLRLLTFRRFKYLITSLPLVPWFVLTLLILLNGVFFSVIFRKRRIAKRMNVEERPQELRLASVCIIIYAIVGVALWTLKNFETYLQVVWCWFLLPQVIANVFWDLRTKPLHWIYLVGISICRIAFIGFNALRPTIYGYDDLDEFPEGWFWGITLIVLFFASYALLQQRYGGRTFLPQRWFGYQELPSSNAHAKQDQSIDIAARAEDRMLDL